MANYLSGIMGSMGGAPGPVDYQSIGGRQRNAARHIQAGLWPQDGGGQRPMHPPLGGWEMGGPQAQRMMQQQQQPGFGSGGMMHYGDSGMRPPPQFGGGQNAWGNLGQAAAAPAGFGGYPQQQQPIDYASIGGRQRNAARQVQAGMQPGNALGGFMQQRRWG